MHSMDNGSESDITKILLSAGLESFVSVCSSFGMDTLSDLDGFEDMELRTV